MRKPKNKMAKEWKGSHWSYPNIKKIILTKKIGIEINQK